MCRPRKNKLPLFDLQNMSPVVFNHLMMSACMTDSFTDPSFRNLDLGFFFPRPDFLNAVLVARRRLVLKLHCDFAGPVRVEKLQLFKKRLAFSLVVLPERYVVGVVDDALRLSQPLLNGFQPALEDGQDHLLLRVDAVLHRRSNASKPTKMQARTVDTIPMPMMTSISGPGPGS